MQEQLRKNQNFPACLWFPTKTLKETLQSDQVGDNKNLLHVGLVGDESQLKFSRLMQVRDPSLNSWCSRNGNIYAQH